MIWNIPNILTLSRVVLIPFVIYFYTSGKPLIAFSLFLFSALTDYFDGKVARALGQTTDIGAILDPIADRIMGVAFYLWVWKEGMIPSWFAVIVVLRNFSQLMCIPILVWWKKRKFYVKPSLFAKWATVFSDGYLFLPLFVFPYFGEFSQVNIGLMVLVSLIELKVLVTYLPRLYAIANGTHDTFE